MLSCFSHVQPCVTLWAVAYQAPLSLGLSGQEYWSGLPCALPGDLPNPGTEPTSLMSFALAGRFFTTRAPRKPYIGFTYSLTFCCSITFQRPSLIFEFSENLSNFLRRLWYSSFYSKVISLSLVCEEKN